MMVVGKKAKSLITIVVWVLAALMFSYTLIQFFNPKEHTVDKAIYSADIISNIEYSVRLKNTPVYNRATNAEPAKYYVMPFTDYINLDCNYSLVGNSEAVLMTNDYVTAFLVAYIDEGNDEVILWKKEYELSELETTQITDKAISGKKNVRVTFGKYTNLIEQVYNDYNFKPNYYLMIVHTTEFNVEYGENTQTRVLQPYLRIDIDDLLFEIKENNSTVKKLEINQRLIVSDEINWDVVIISSTLFLLLAVLAILLPSKILTSVHLTENAKAIKQINIKYGDRIVKILEPTDTNQIQVKVACVEDVVKISDEIGQPVFSAYIDKEVYFYVINNDVMYYITIVDGL